MSSTTPVSSSSSSITIATRPAPQPAAAAAPSNRVARPTGFPTISSVERVRTASAPGLSAGFAISPELRNEVRALEAELAGHVQDAEAKRSAAASSEQLKQSTWDALGFWDKYFRWIPLFHDKAKIAAYKAAKSSDASADSAVAAASAKVSAADASVVKVIGDFLRTSPSSMFGTVERQRDEARSVLASTRRFAQALASAESALDSAISAKQWDNTNDTLAALNNRNNNNSNTNSIDFSDLHASSARNEARAAVARAQGAADGFAAALAGYRGTVVGRVSSIDDLGLGNGVLDYFTQDSVLVGHWQVAEMQSAARQIAVARGQVDAIEQQLAAHEARYAGEMDAQVQAVRRACV